MEISDTIRTLAKIRQSIETWVLKSTAGPNELIADLNDLHIAATDNQDFDDLFEYDDVDPPSITLVVSIDTDFDLQKVMNTMRTRLRIQQPERKDEIGHAGIVWSHGRYDFVYDSHSDSLRISHRYSHKRVDTKSVSSIVKQMIDYAIDYLEAVKSSAKEDTGRPETD